MKWLRTAVNEAEFEAIHKISEEEGISIYALLKKALFRYLDKYSDKYADFLVAISDKIGEEVDDRFPALSEKLDNAIDPERIPQVVTALHEQHTGKASFRLAETTTDREEETLDLFLQTIQRIRELPPEEFNAYVASLEGLLKQVESKKPP